MVEQLVSLVFYAVALLPALIYISLRVYYAIDKVPKHLQARELAWFHPSVGEYVVPRSRISPEIQAEIDQTPEWWDKRFHELLSSVQSRLELEGEDEWVEEHTLNGAKPLFYRLPKPYEYLGCTCRDCRNVRARR